MIKDATFADVIEIEELQESCFRTTVEAVEVFVEAVEVGIFENGVSIM